MSSLLFLLLLMSRPRLNQFKVTFLFLLIVSSTYEFFIEAVFKRLAATHTVVLTFC